MKKEQVIDTDGQIVTKVTYLYGTIEYRNTKGKIHRIGGPAVIWPNGTQEYWVDDIEYTEEQYPQALFEYNLKQVIL